jgi:hypothetical protein
LHREFHALVQGGRAEKNYPQMDTDREIQEESTAEDTEGRREKREETKYQFFSAAFCVLCG